LAIFFWRTYEPTAKSSSRQSACTASFRSGSSPPPTWRRFIVHGYRAILTCVDTQAIDAAFAGREYDDRLLADLPPGCDPAGENGEFHSFVYAGPLFARPISATIGESVLRNQRFQFRDLLPAR
jgi:diphthamide synthase (EF-2-diphthine--ammonia ligase)